MCSGEPTNALIGRYIFENSQPPFIFGDAAVEARPQQKLI